MNDKLNDIMTKPISSEYVDSDESSKVVKEIQATRSLMIKTDNLIQTIFHEMKEFRKENKNHVTENIFKNIVIFVLFALICFGGLYLAFDAKISRYKEYKTKVTELEFQIQNLLSQVEKLKNEKQEMFDKAKKLDTLLQSNKGQKALAYYKDVKNELIQAGIYTGFIDSNISKVSQQSNQELIDETVKLYRQGRYQKTAEIINDIDHDSLDYNETARVKFVQADVFRRLNNLEQAETAFKDIILNYVKSDYIDDATYLLGITCLNRGKKQEANDLFRSYYTNYPKGIYINQIKRLLNLHQVPAETTEEPFQETSENSSNPLSSTITED
ncbi:MAG: tetratricopeptide repeat protein [Pseudomonadota bacterium]